MLPSKGDGCNPTRSRAGSSCVVAPERQQGDRGRLVCYASGGLPGPRSHEPTSRHHGDAPGAMLRRQRCASPRRARAAMSWSWPCPDRPRGRDDKDCLAAFGVQLTSMSEIQRCSRRRSHNTRRSPVQGAERRDPWPGDLGPRDGPYQQGSDECSRSRSFRRIGPDCDRKHSRWRSPSTA